MWPFSVIRSENGGKTKVETPDLSGQKYQTQFEHFVESIIDDTKPISPASQGMEVLQMLDGIYRSSRIGKAVRIDRG